MFKFYYLNLVIDFGGFAYNETKTIAMQKIKIDYTLYKRWEDYWGESYNEKQQKEKWD